MRVCVSVYEEMAVRVHALTAPYRKEIPAAVEGAPKVVVLSENAQAQQAVADLRGKHDTFPVDAHGDFNPPLEAHGDATVEGAMAADLAAGDAAPAHALLGSAEDAQRLCRLDEVVNDSEHTRKYNPTIGEAEAPWKTMIRRPFVIPLFGFPSASSAA